MRGSEPQLKQCNNLTIRGKNINSKLRYVNVNAVDEQISLALVRQCTLTQSQHARNRRERNTFIGQTRAYIKGNSSLNYRSNYKEGFFSKQENV